MARKKVFNIGSSLANSLKETVESASNYSGELNLEVIPLSWLELDPENPRDLALTFDDIKEGISKSDPNFQRKTEELESIKSLSESIKSQGIINPITVYKHGDKYRLIAGERRSLASLLAGKRDIQAKILNEKPDELKKSLLQWIENIERQDLSLWEKLNNLEKIIEAYASANGINPASITAVELAKIIGCGKSQAANYKIVLNADKDLRSLISDNKIVNLEKAAILANIKEKSTRTAATMACIDGANIKQLKTLASQSKSKPVMSSKATSTRGRKTIAINLGATKSVNVAKLILESVIQNEQLAHMTQEFKEISWDSPRSVNEAFKKLLKKLEALHA